MDENNCTHDCSTCGADCSSRENVVPAKLPLADGSRVNRVIGVVSGKGGVGKSLITSLLSVAMRRREYGVAIIDADVTGPSVPKAFGIKGGVESTGDLILPRRTTTGIDLISVNLLLQNETDPVVWRGPVISGLINQFWSQVFWTDVDYMFIDMPPGTGDVPLTVFQSIPVDGIIVVSTPQDLVSMIVEKAVKMARLMDVPVLGLVENMSFVRCPDCGKEIDIFGASRADEVCQRLNVPLIARLPVDPAFASLCDRGTIELYENEIVEKVADKIEEILPITVNK
ncbi:MAG: Mrp/NBP35 family ATP-binding protein [Clostridia bacterium]|nr:Mrp/NBP35 family ATP-binding protein [Clostridia bacterium]